MTVPAPNAPAPANTAAITAEEAAVAAYETSFWTNDEGWQLGWVAAVAVAALAHGAMFVAGTNAPVKKKEEPITMAIAVPPPPPEIEAPPPPPPPPPPKEKPQPPPDLPPPPNQTPPPPTTEPPPPIVTGVTAESVVATNTGGPTVRVGNTTFGDPDHEKFTPPTEVKAVAAIHFDPSAYRSGAIALINKQKRYPRKAQVLGLEGNCIAKFAIDRAGNIVVPPKVLGKGSGHDVLDAECLRMIEATAPYPQLIGDDVTVPHFITVPVQFRIGDP